MHVLFVHRSGSGQFAHLITRLLGDGHEVTLVTESLAPARAGLRQSTYVPGPTAATSPLLQATDYHVRTGEAVAAVLSGLGRDERPDVVVGHTGWGGLLFVKDALPRVPVLGYCEYFYNADGADLDFDPRNPVPPMDRRRIRLRNAAQLLTLEAIDSAYAPTRWQQRQYPAAYRGKIAICHDGIDTQACRPDPEARFALPDGRTLRPGDPVVTFAARDLDPYRGYPQFMRAAVEVARRRPDAIFVVVGGDGPGYGRPRSDGRLWREVMLDETGLGARVVHIPWLAHESLLALFQVSAAHVYLSVPFVLSWSALEAMACGALVVGSATPPVQEVLSDGVNGLLAPFFDREALAGAILGALAPGAATAGLRKAARATVAARYEREACVDRQFGFVEGLALQSDDVFA